MAHYFLDISTVYEMDHYFLDISTVCSSTVCSGSSDQFYKASLLYKMAHYFLDILYYNLGVRVPQGRRFGQ